MGGNVCIQFWVGSARSGLPSVQKPELSPLLFFFEDPVQRPPGRPIERLFAILKIGAYSFCRNGRIWVALSTVIIDTDYTGGVLIRHDKRTVRKVNVLFDIRIAAPRAGPAFRMH
jgi:hypothetical protein